MRFVHLHNHSEYSFLDGAASPREMAERAASLGQEALAITDHGTMSGVVEFYKECKKVGIKPLIGVELYITPLGQSMKSRVQFSKAGCGDGLQHRDYYHIVAIAKDAVGYSNMCKLVSKSYIDGFYYKPRIDFDLLAECNDGLFIGSACLAGEVNHFLSIGEAKKAAEVASAFKDLLSDRYYLEIQYNGFQQQLAIIPGIRKLAKDLSIRAVITNDSHFAYPEQAMLQAALTKIQSSSSTGEPEGEGMYIKSLEEIRAAIPDATASEIEGTAEIADAIGFEIELGAHNIPVYDITTDAAYGDFMKSTIERQEVVGR